MNKEEEIPENRNLEPKWKATSAIWKDFGYQGDDTGQTLVLCLTIDIK